MAFWHSGILAFCHSVILSFLSFSSLPLPLPRLCPSNLRRLLQVHALARATGTMHFHPCQAQIQAPLANGAAAVGCLCALWPPQGLQSENGTLRTRAVTYFTLPYADCTLHTAHRRLRW
jgi:hypothetical protein